MAPPAFAAALVAFLVLHPQAAASFVPYPFLLDALGEGWARRPVGRFVSASGLFFLVPYLVTGLLLLMADVGLGAATALWRRGAKPRPGRSLPPEAVWSFAIAAVGASAAGGGLLDRVARGGELPGGVNVAPLFVAAVPFVAMGLALLVAFAATLPRAALDRWGIRNQARPERPGLPSSRR